MNLVEIAARCWSGTTATIADLGIVVCDRQRAVLPAKHHDRLPRLRSMTRRPAGIDPSDTWEDLARRRTEPARRPRQQAPHQANNDAQEVAGMAQDNTLARSLHDLGLATWFGGSLMGAVGLNGAAAVVDQPAQRLRVANAGWARWTPVNLAGIAAHLAGGAVLVAGNKGRLATQRGVAGATVAKATVTGLALAATAYSRALGERLMQAGDAPVEGGTTPTDDTPPELANAQRQLTVLQWVIPGLTGTALVLNALMGEQQRPQQVTSGLLGGLRSRLPVLALAGTGLLVRARGRRKPTR
jgi:hypothetical protein